MKEFPFPSLFLLKKITEGQLDAVKCAKSLKSQGVISEGEVLMFHEITYRNVKNTVAVKKSVQMKTMSFIKDYSHL